MDFPSHRLLRHHGQRRHRVGTPAERAAAPGAAESQRGGVGVMADLIGTYRHW